MQHWFGSTRDACLFLSVLPPGRFPCDLSAELVGRGPTGVGSNWTVVHGHALQPQTQTAAHSREPSHTRPVSGERRSALCCEEGVRPGPGSQELGGPEPPWSFGNVFCLTYCALSMTRATSLPDTASTPCAQWSALNPRSPALFVSVLPHPGTSAAGVGGVSFVKRSS